MLRRTTILFVFCAAVTNLAQAVQLKQGEVVCHSHKALLEMQAAQRSGDRHTIEWLYNGAVCLPLPETTEVRVLDVVEDGNQKLKTLNRRRNLELWAHVDSLD